MDLRESLSPLTVEIVSHAIGYVLCREKLDGVKPRLKIFHMESANALDRHKKPYMVEK